MILSEGIGKLILIISTSSLRPRLHLPGSLYYAKENIMRCRKCGAKMQTVTENIRNMKGFGWIGEEPITAYADAEYKYEKCTRCKFKTRKRLIK